MVAFKEIPQAASIYINRAARNKKDSKRRCHTWKMGLCYHRQKIPKDLTYHKEDQTMKKSVHSSKMIIGIKYRKIKDGDNVIQQLVLPEVYRATVLQGMHNDVGHHGRDRTLSLIKG